MNLQILSPLIIPQWDELVSVNANASVFHSSGWARVLYESYGYEPIYFALLEDGKIEVLLPFMETRSVFARKKAVSLPFTDYCEPLSPEKADFKEVLDAVIRHSKGAGWSSVELRGCKSPLADTPPLTVYRRHTLDLSKGEDALLAGLRGSTRRNIKKSAGTGTEVTLHTSKSAVRQFYRLHCMTRKLHGLPPQPFRFFDMIHEHLLKDESGVVAIARNKTRVIAGAVFLHFRDKAVYKYGASDRRYQHLRANNLVMWHAIQWYTRRGFRSLCFGRTDPQNDGLLQFKRGWGALEEMLHYYKYDVARSAFVTESSKIASLHTSVFRAMPMPLLRLAGALLYRYMG